MSALGAAVPFAGRAVARAVAPAVANPPQASDVSPGIAGFLVVFVLALATVVLVRSMVGHLRKVRYSPGPEGPQRPGEPGTGGPPVAGGTPPGAQPDATAPRGTERPQPPG